MFSAYNDSFRGGVNVAAGDVDGDGSLDEGWMNWKQSNGPMRRLQSDTNRMLCNECAQ